MYKKHRIKLAASLFALLIFVIVVLCFYFKDISIQNVILNSSSVSTSSQVSVKSETEFQYDQPSGWTLDQNLPNAKTFKSPDFKAQFGYQGISAGSIITIADYGENPMSLDENSLIQVDYNGTRSNLKSIKVGGEDAIYFSHNVGENHNNHDVVLIKKYGRLFIIEQQYSRNFTNPNQDAFNTVLGSFHFLK